MTKNLKLTTCYEDFELKKLLFNFALTVSKNSTSNQVEYIIITKKWLKKKIPILNIWKSKLLSESGILLALLSFIKPVESNRDVREWSISQYEELQLHSMSTLCILIPILMKDFATYHGSSRLLVFLEWCINEKSKKKIF